MPAIVATFQIQDGKGADFEKVFTELSSQVKAKEPGCLLYQLVRSRNEPNTYKVLELYRDQAAIDAHMQTEHFKAAGAKLGGFVAGAPDIQFFETVD